MAAEWEGSTWGSGSIRQKIQQWESLDEARSHAKTSKRPTLSKQQSLGRLEETLPAGTRNTSPGSGRRSVTQTVEGGTRQESWKTNGTWSEIEKRNNGDSFQQSEVKVGQVNGSDSKTERTIIHREQTQSVVKEVEATEIRVHPEVSAEEKVKTADSQRKKAIEDIGPELHAPELVALLLGRGAGAIGDTNGGKVNPDDAEEEITEIADASVDAADVNADADADTGFTSDWHYVEPSDLLDSEKDELSDETVELEADDEQEYIEGHSLANGLEGEEIDSRSVSRMTLLTDVYADEEDGGENQAGNENENEIVYTTDMVGPCMLAREEYESDSSSSSSNILAPTPATLDYSKVKGHATLKFDWCDVKFPALLYLRSINAKRQFRIATSVQGAGTFGDIVFKHRTSDDDSWKTCFIQLKHKENVPITNESLTAVDGSFSLAEDYRSYCDIRDRMGRDTDEDVFSGSFEECSFVLHTNAALSERLASRLRPGISGDIERLLKSGLNDDRIFSLGEESDKDVYSAMGNELRGFLKSLVIFSGQPSEIEVDHLVKMELRAACSKYLSNVHIIYRFFVEAVQQWWTDSPNYLTQKINVLDKAENILNVYNLTANQKHAFKLHEVSFRAECTATWRAEIRKANPLLYIVTAGLSSKFSCTKLMQVLREENVEYIFTSLRALLQQETEVIVEWSSGQKDILVIVSESSSDDEDDLCNALSKVFANKPHKQLVLLSPPCNAFVMNFQSKFKTPFEEIFDPFDILQLDKDTTDQLLEREVRLQGYPIFLKCVVGDDLELISQVITSDNFDTLIANNTVNIGKTVQGSVHHYVKRTIERRDVIKADIFKSDIPGAIAVSNISPDHLQSLVPDGATIGHASEPNTDAFKYLILNSFNPAEDFVRLCETRDDGVHWLKRSRNSFVWQRSSHDLDSLALYKNGDIRRLTPEHVLDLDDRVILVAAEKSSGKTALTSHLALETKQSDPSLWVVKIDLGACIPLLENSDVGDLSAFNFLSLLENDDTDFLGVDLLCFCVENTGNVAVFLDGFDNVVPIYLEKVLALLDSLVASRIKKIFVTCDPSMQELLERRLSTFAYRLCPEERVGKVIEENARESFV